MNRILQTALTLSFLTMLTACGGKPQPAAESRGGESLVSSMLKANKLEGRVVLVEFGAIGCELSGSGLDAMADWQRRKLFPDLAFIRLDAPGDQVVALGMPEPDFEAYYATKNLGFPVVRDEGMSIANALGTTIFPRFALLDRFGRVRYRGSQPAEKDLADWTKKLHAEQTDAGPNASVFGTAALDAPSLLVGTRLPDLSGKVKSLSEYQGPKGVLITFIDTRCPFSASASKEMPAVAAKLAAQGIATVLVNIGDPEAEVRKSYGDDLPGVTLVFDSGKQTQQNWNAQFVPLVVLLDTAGKIIYRGSPVWGAVASALEKNLNLPVGSVKLDAQGTNQG